MPVLIALVFAFWTSCTREECDRECKEFTNIHLLALAYDGPPSCGKDIGVPGGGLFRTTVPEPPETFARRVSRCFTVSQPLRITPSAGISVQLYRLVPPNCREGELLGENSAPGEVLVYSTEEICWEIMDEAILVKAYGAAGTLTFESP